MAKGTAAEKLFRKELSQHLYRMHGFVSVPSLPTLSLQELEELHKMFHVDKYMCPPHEHAEADGYELGKPRLSLGDDYFKEVINALKGEM